MFFRRIPVCVLIAIAFIAAPDRFALSDEADSKSAARQERRKKAEAERNARLAVVEPEFSKVYRLKAGEVLRNVSEPLNRELRRKWYAAVFGRDLSDQMKLVTLYLQWKDGAAKWSGATMGGGNGMPVRSVLPMLKGASFQEIDGDEELLQKIIPGDWVYDPKAPPEKIVAAMEPLLMIRPPWGSCFLTKPNAERAHRNMPVMLTLLSASQSSKASGVNPERVKIVTSRGASSRHFRVRRGTRPEWVKISHGDAPIEHCTVRC